MNFAWLDFVGLVLALSGAVILALGLITSRRQALNIGVPRMAEDSDEKNICLPSVRDRLRESRFALIGGVLLTIGFLLQIMAKLPVL